MKFKTGILKAKLSLRKSEPSRPILLLLGVIIICSTALQSCKKSRSEIGKVVFKETRNRIFKSVENSTFISVFKDVLDKSPMKGKQNQLIKNFYESNDFQPVMVERHLSDKGFTALVDRLKAVREHGLDSSMFHTARLESLIDSIYDKKKIRTLDQAYKIIAELELSSASALVEYSDALQFGIVNPRRIYGQYYIETKRPDSTSVVKALSSGNLKNYLDSIQPKAKDYLALQKALKENLKGPGLSVEDTRKLLQVNLERLRWKNWSNAPKMVVVNIPDFKLNVLENGKSVLSMKVCVGEGRELSEDDKLTEYDPDDLKKDRPFRRETPELNSLIHSVQVNPVWNIPESIASREITKHAAADRYYLANNNIDVYKGGQIVENPETIDWTDEEAGKEYQFKQRPGDNNSLGKIKFLFNNQSAVYLHDTPAKAAFDQEVRAVSHGCVRVENPLGLARALFGPGEKFDLIKREMSQSSNQEAKDIALPKKIPVYLIYFTCWQDDFGKLQFRKDIYGQDLILFSHFKRLMNS